ncbi:uncharacterized protein N7473_000144 [Penicillium subrubescens]|uniref:uncharacterized protein n=1 Tax=Penicillium subrubescens TaxID=1316194 RepID=UPI0025459770|nr:uncharacterized protein N7473_000144 [Penicillium subrubescens]KAJ5910841.1 hypothetical protein N7473_000144 [Penicillium subrubescens]
MCGQNLLAQIRQGHGHIRFAGSDIAGLDVGAIEDAMESAAAAAPRDIAAGLATSDMSLPATRPPAQPSHTQRERSAPRAVVLSSQKGLA